MARLPVLVGLLSLGLALALPTGADQRVFAAGYTDSWPFRNYTAGSNPHRHQPTDLFTTYSDDDFRLGFNAVQMSLGTVAEFASALIAP